MLGLILLLVLKVCSSDAVQATVGSTITLECTVSGSSYQWQKWLETHWSVTIQDSSKYGNTDTAFLIIYNIVANDAGTYRCTTPSSDGSQQIYITLAVTDTVGTWTPWSQWTTCSKTCGVGTSTRNRVCTGGSCDGTGVESLDCATTPCPVNGNWGIWGAWSACSTTCGSGTWTKYRICDNPAPANGGSDCSGLYYETTQCVKPSCPAKVNGQWSEWRAWGACSTTCGSGTRARYRSCDNPAPANGGSYCSGQDYETTPCYNPTCPVNGRWSEWRAWSACSTTCGSGTWTRYRSCDNPAPANGGSYCSGLDYETTQCLKPSCPVHGNWSAWHDWNSCSATCGIGSRSRYQECNNPEPANGGSDCQGNDTEIESCSITLCQEALETSLEAGPIAGGVSAVVLLLVVIVIVIVCVKRRRQTPHAKETCEVKNNDIICDNQDTEEDKTFRTGRDDQLYINFSIPNRTSSTDTDDDILPTSSKINKSPNNTMTYENIRDVNSCVKVEDLKGYIGRKQINEGLKEEYKSIPYGVQHPTTKSQLKENVPKNRFRTTWPYDHSRVILETDHGSGKSDYINANYIDGFEKDKCYIASQGPTKSTIPDHWRMIWQNNVKKIVMLTNLEESGKIKCEKYWPVGGKSMTYGNLVLTLVTEKERAAYVTREISVMNKKTKEKRVVTQHHFTAWPDHGTPDPLYLVLFHRHVTTDHNPTESSPFLVHCSAGIGRTGTYIALDALLEEGRTTGYVNLVNFLRKMRYSRMNMIQTPDQYVCLHYALLEAFTMKDTSIRKEKFNEIWSDIQSDKRPINLQRINEEFKMLEAKKSEHESPEYMAAMSTENIDKNRNRNSVAMDSTRLYLMTFEKGRSNFINAVQVPSYTKFVGYLSTQLPLPDTKVDFWTMIRDHSSSTIVLILNDSQEADLVYAASTDSFTCGTFTMKITKREKRELDITETTLVMSRKDDKQPKEIAIYQIICKNMPDPKVLCRLVDLISTRISMSSDPVTVVSSDGAKNCGLFCAFTNAVSSMKIDETADIFQLIRLLQLRRPEFFEDFEEYRLCYEALNIYIDSSNVYANF